MDNVEKAKKIKVFISDVDGTLTDGKIYVGAESEAIKVFSARDGLGISVAQKLGYEFILITGRRSLILEYRAQELKIKEVHQGCRNKLVLLKELCQEKNLVLDEVVYIGDDLNDLAALEAAGLGCAPADAAVDIQKRADFLSSRNGGDGAVREVIEFVLASQGRWQEALNLFTEG